MCHVVSTESRLVESDSRDAVDLVLVIDHGIGRRAMAGLARTTAWLTEVDAAREFAHHQHVDALDDLWT